MLHSYISGSLLDGKTDIAVNTFGWKVSRANVVDYLPISDGSLIGHVYIKNPQETFDMLAYIKPLYPNAWIGVIIFCLVVPIFMAIILRNGK